MRILRGRPLFRKKEVSPAPPPEKPKLHLDMIAAAPAEPEAVAAAPAEPEAVAAALSATDFSELW